MKVLPIVTVEVYEVGRLEMFQTCVHTSQML
jgi:hypothetical protein